MAAVSVIQPMTSGIGGDCHSLFYKCSERKVYAVNGSGRSGVNATLERVQSAGIIATTEREFSNHGLWVSVPGTVGGMCCVIKKFGSGKLTMEQILEPAIKLAEEGVPVPYKTSVIWDEYKRVLKNSKQAADILNNGESPQPGEKLFAQKLAQSLKLIALQGEKGFYSGKIAAYIAKEVQQAGGVLTLEDMKDHLTAKSIYELCDPIFIDFHGFRVWEMKPNTIGLIPLVALNILQLYDLYSLGHNSAEYIHIVASVIACASRECWNYICDPNYATVSFKSLLTEETSRKLKTEIDSGRAINACYVISGGNTSYVAAVDPEGNGCSFICSVSSDFGAGIIPENCGFVLHDRLKCMSLDPKSPNAFGPKKLPLHSIIPSMITDSKTKELLAVFGHCGRWMQPQGQIQSLLNMIIFGMDPQMALDQPRFYVGDCRTLTDFPDTVSMISLEDGISTSAVPFLQEKGHEVKHSIKGFPTAVFGKGNIVARPAIWNRSAKDSQKCWWAAADPRTDGCAMGF